MTEQQLLALGPALADYLDQFLFCCGYTQTFEHLQVYCRGLLSDLPRKSVEPIARAAGTPVRTLQEFLRDHVWNAPRVRDLLQHHVRDALTTVPADDLGTIGLVDETSQPKKGTKTPGVQRQHCGRLGKVENCIVTVHLGVCKGRYKTLIDGELFLPQEWSNDRERCRAAGIPDAVVYRSKWQIALEEIDRAQAQGVVFDWLTFDEGYGKSPGFVGGLDQRHLRFVGEVPKSFSCLAGTRSGRRPGVAAGGHAAEAVVRQASVFVGQSWQRVRLGRQTLGEQLWEVKAAQVWAKQDGQWSTRMYWLLWARNPSTGEEKYFLSNAPPSARVETLLRVGFRRWNVEHSFRLSKSEIGFGHYEGQDYTALLRHLTLCQLALTFVAGQAERLRGEKSGGDAGAGLSGLEHAECSLVGETAGHGSTPIHPGHHSLPPTPQPASPPFTTKKTQTMSLP
jgi:SRSO17 transposase